MKKKISMPHELDIVPTKEDAITGICNSPTKCMYVLPIRRRFKTATYVAVNPNGITITIDGMYYHYMIPKLAVAKMAEFDNGKPIDVSKAAIRATLANYRMANYESTPEAREYHRLKSARRRADPEYVRPEGRQTLRAIIARSGVKVSADKRRSA